MQRSVILVVCTVILRQNFIQRNLHRKDTKLNPLLEIKLNAIKNKSAARDERFSHDTTTSRPTIVPTITNAPTTPPSSNLSTTTTYSTTTTSPQTTTAKPYEPTLEPTFEPTTFESNFSSTTGDILIFGHFGSRDTTAGLFFGLQKAKLIY